MSVTIKGHYFSGTTRVSFGGVAALSFGVISDSVISATVGMGATGQVKVTTPLGSDSLGGFTYIFPDITAFTPGSGTTGTLITIHGHYFTGAIYVSIGRTNAASFTVVSDSVITATVGAGTTGAVRVVTRYGTALFNGFTFIASVQPPSITAFTPTIANAGALVTITGNHFSNATYVSIGGIAAASFTVVSDSVITAVMATGATGAVMVITPGGTDVLGGFSYVSGNGHQITVAPNPATGYAIVYHPVVGSAQIRLIDMMGAVIRTAAVGPNTSMTRLNVTGIKQGIYVVSWSDGSNTYNKLILIK